MTGFGRDDRVWVGRVIARVGGRSAAIAEVHRLAGMSRMLPLPFTLDELSAEHLVGLIEAEATESAVVEFKSAPYTPDHEGAREFLKDITALANTAGGLILIGVGEEGGVAVALNPIKIVDADKIKQRLESLLQTAVEPRLFGVGLRTVPIAGGCVLAVRVARSQTPPHRVTAKNSNRFYLRSSAGAYEASMDELRALFLQTAAIRDRALAFRDQRLAALSINRGSVPLKLRDDKLVLHIIPISAFGLAPAIDLATARKTSGAFRPLNATGWNACFNSYGHLNTRGGPECHGYTQLFREGIVEAVYVGVKTDSEKNPAISAPYIAEMLIEHVPVYIDGLSAVGATPPFFVLVSLQGVDGATVLFDNRRWSGEAQPLVGDLLLPICVVEDTGSQDFYTSSLKPALDALWNAGDRPGWT